MKVMLVIDHPTGGRSQTDLGGAPIEMTALPEKTVKDFTTLELVDEIRRRTMLDPEGDL